MVSLKPVKWLVELSLQPLVVSIYYFNVYTVVYVLYVDRELQGLLVEKLAFLL